jgi:CubicO group peptidase (beta-lactamase class C family)
LLAPLPAAAQSVGGQSLEGNWARVDSNYDPYDLMRIRVDANGAVLTAVPPAASDAYSVGLILWRGIQSDGSVQIRGSDGNYYPARINFEGSDVVHIDIQHTAPGDDQTWRRAGPSVDGDWERVAAEGAPEDGTQVRAQGAQASIRYLPSSAPRRYRVGTRLWRNIGADGAMEVLGSDGRYHPARVTLLGNDRLRIDSGSPSLESGQIWVRPGVVEAARATQACTWSDREPSAGANVWTTASTALPAELLDVLRNVKRAGAAIQTLAVTPSDEWVVVADNIPCYSAGFPARVRGHLDSYIASGRTVDVVAFGSGGRWVIIAEDWMRRSAVPEAAAERVRQLQEEGRRISAFAFAPDPNGAALTSDSEIFIVGPVPDRFEEAVAAARMSARPVHDVAFGGDGAWALVAGDWFVTNGAPLNLLRDLDRYRTDEDRRIDRVLLDPRRGGSRWAIVSNRKEPAPIADAGEMERSLGPDDDGSIWARMKAHDIRGLAVAVIENNRVAWIRGYGSRGGGVGADGMPDLERYVYPSTIFDAASISKPVAAVGVLRLVDEGKLDLTTGHVLQDLVGSVVSPSMAYALAPLDPNGDVNLARLLSHCAGVDHQNGTSGAEALDPDQTEPSIQNVILGVPPAGDRFRAVRSFTPGDSMHYSGANYALVQGLIEAHADGGFDTHMRALFNELGMTHSSFRPPGDRSLRYAYGHDDSNDSCGSAGRCPVKAFPNKAAAGLTTTVQDLAHFVIMLNQGGTYAGRRVLRQETVDRMLKRDGAGGSSLAEQQCNRLRNMGLGMRVDDRGTSMETFLHGGLHNGFRTFIYGLPEKDAGLVLLMTGEQDDANDLRAEIWSRFRAVYP